MNKIRRNKASLICFIGPFQEAIKIQIRNHFYNFIFLYHVTFELIFNFRRNHPNLYSHQNFLPMVTGLNFQMLIPDQGPPNSGQWAVWSPIWWTPFQIIKLGWRWGFLNSYISKDDDYFRKRFSQLRQKPSKSALFTLCNEHIIFVVTDLTLEETIHKLKKP